MRETRLSGSEGGGTEFNRFSLPLSRPAPVILSKGQSQHISITAMNQEFMSMGEGAPPEILDRLLQRKMYVGRRSAEFIIRTANLPSACLRLHVESSAKAYLHDPIDIQNQNAGFYVDVDTQEAQ